MDKPNLLLISDLLGNRDAEYLLKYESLLETRFSVSKIDACQLAEFHNSQEVDKNHSAFIMKGGLTKAVKNLQDQYLDKVDCIIGFSIGGTIAWQACLQNLNVRRLICISATRLRYETQKPSCNIELYFGQDDNYRPSENWELLSKVESKIIVGSGHELYKEDGFIKSISIDIVNEYFTH